MAQAEQPGVGEFLRVARTRRGLSQRVLCQRIGRSMSYVSKLEGDQIDPSFEAVAEVAVVLGLTSVELWMLCRVSAVHRLTRLPDSSPKEGVCA